MGVISKRFLAGIVASAVLFVGNSAFAATQTVATGRVVSDQGPALAGVSVECHTSNGSFSASSTTDASGNYTCSGETSSLVVGTTQMTVEVHNPPEGYNSPEAYGFTWTGSAASHDFTLISAPYTVNVTVRDTDGNPIVADVIVQPINITPGQSATQATGATSEGSGTDSIAVSFTDGIVLAEANLSEQNAERYPWVAIGGAQQVHFSDTTTTADLEFTVVRSATKVSVKMVDADGAILTGNNFNGDIYFEGYNDTYGSVSTRRKVNQTTGVTEVYLLPGIWHVSAIHQQLQNQSFDPAQTTFVVSDEPGTTDLGTIQATENTGSLSGTVKMTAAKGESESFIGTTIEVVNLDTNNRFSGNIEPDGKFDIQNVGLGTYTLTLSGENVIPTASATAEVTSGKTTVENIKLTGEFANQTLSGTLKDANNNTVTNFEGVVVVETAHGEFSAPVSPEGAYSIPMFTDGLNGDDVTLTLVTQTGADGYAQPKAFSITNADPTVNLVLKTDEGTISGNVKNDSNQNLTESTLGEHATVTAINTTTGALETTEVNSDGSYELMVGPGTWNLVPHLEDADATVYAGTVSGAQVKVAAGQAVTKNVTVLQETSNISGTVKDADGEPVPEAPVVVTNLPALRAAGNVNPAEVVNITTTADSDGNVNVDVPAGKYTLQFGTTPDIEGQTAPESKAVTASASKDATFTATFEDNGNTKLQGKVDGSFTSASVTAYSPDGGSVSADVNKSGSYQLGVTPGEWKVVVSGVKNGELFLEQENLEVKTGKNKENFAPQATGIAFPAAVTVTAPADELVTVGNDAGAQVTLPAYAAGFSGDITVTLAPVVDFNNSSELSQLGIAYDVRVVDDSGIPVTTLNQDATVSIPLDAPLVGGVSEQAITAAYYNEAMGSNLFDGITSDVKDNNLVIQTSHFSQFSAATSGNVVYAPAQIRKGNLSASSITGTAARLAWKAPLASNARRYKLQVRKQNVTKEKQWMKFTTTQTSQLVTGLAGNTNYQFRVQACNLGGCGEFSEWAKFKTK